MIISTELSNEARATLHKNWGWFLLWGILLFILGLCAISLSSLTTIVSVVLLGAIILISGIIIIIDTFKFWWGKWLGFFLDLAMGILYVAAGVLLIQRPVLGAVSITLLLGIFYVVVGAFRIIYSLSLRMPRWGWSLLNGIIALILGLLILAAWPSSSLFIIGLFVGIDLLFLGLAYMMISLSAHSYTEPSTLKKAYR
jgi:uncharacterized membrane protein HdeD (DUF308 family)